MIEVTLREKMMGNNQQWKFEIGDIVSTTWMVQATVEENKRMRAAGVWTRIGTPRLGVIMNKKYDQCFGGCEQKFYIVESSQGRMELSELSLVGFKEVLEATDEDRNWSIEEMIKDDRRKRDLP